MEATGVITIFWILEKPPGWQKVLVIVVVQLQVAITNHQASHERDQENVHTGLQHPINDWMLVQLTIGFVYNLNIWICLKLTIAFVIAITFVQ